jgi:aminomethyltransferase
MKGHEGDLRMKLRVTPFHFRAADANAYNAWVERGGFTLAAAYGGTRQEALAARFAVVMGDISWRWRLAVQGARAADFLSYLTGRTCADLTPGMARQALWLTDNGAVRGVGLIARLDESAFVLGADRPDRNWIAAAAAPFGVALRERRGSDGGLVLIGPYARALLGAAGLDNDIAPFCFRRQVWAGLKVMLARWGLGYELWCRADDAPIVWDRLRRAGKAFALQPAGQAALDVLDVEAGILRAGRDYDPAQDSQASAPTPDALGLEAWAGAERVALNGGEVRAKTGAAETIVGVQFDSSLCAPHAALYAGRRMVGQMLTCVYSPALRRAIGFARLERNHAWSGTPLTLTPPPSRADASPAPITASVHALPFLPLPDYDA